jgi:hypothetical protein
MRPSLWLSLVSLCVSVAALQTSYCTAQGVKRGKDRVEFQFNARQSTRENPKWDVDGFGKDETSARQEALDEAAKEVQVWLNKQGIRWTASPEVLHDYVRRSGMVTQKGPVHDEDLPEAGPVKRATMTVELRPNHLHDLERLARQGVMQERQGFLVRVLIALVVLLTVTAGYFRLEEATRGFYTGLLRVVAVGILTLVVLGLCVVG